jgi:glycerophosphoryl diester phosphodiesterase
MMQSHGNRVDVLCHRGLWGETVGQNSAQAFEGAFAAGYGIETDLRDDRGTLVVSHDPPAGHGHEMPAAELFQLYRGFSDLPLAINIKSDGLAQPLAALLRSHAVENYFVFDMAVPDARQQLAASLRVFTRHSEWEQHPAFYELAAGVWLDAFFKEWWTLRTIEEHLRHGKAVAIVSPELHGRDPEPVWLELTKLQRSARARPRVLLCTDHPRAADKLINHDH